LVRAAIDGAPPSLSFEFFPPRGEEGRAVLRDHVARLAEVAPDFASVTYGAGGSAADRRSESVRVTRLIGRAGGLPTMAHLTLVGHTRSELAGVLEDFLDAGAQAVLALRGDPPGGPSEPWRPVPGGLHHAVELVELVRASGPVDIGVAAFPFGHPSAAGLAADTAVLAAKQRAGASFAITQMLFSAAAYAELAARAGAGGATLPIVPGVMPITSAGQIARLEAFSGAPLPAGLARRLAGAADQDVPGIGVEWTAGLVADLLDAGAPGIHFYTLNRSMACLEVCRRLGLRGGGRRAPA
jgi:methylenetetrahydrofolate reductase (NADPH)